MLAPTDLTGNGLWDRITFDVSSLTGSFWVRAEVTSGASGFSSAYFWDITTLGPQSCSLSWFGGDADLTAVNGLDLVFATLAPNSSITFGEVQVVPEPSSIALLALGLLCIATTRRCWTAGLRGRTRLVGVDHLTTNRIQ
jgi:hypothetical protein